MIQTVLPHVPFPGAFMAFAAVDESSTVPAKPSPRREREAVKRFESKADFHRQLRLQHLKI